MAMGRAVVSTSIGAEGISAVPSLDLLIADSAEDIASAAVKLIQSPALREQMERRGRELVCLKYRWSDITASALDQIFHRNVMALKA